MREKFKSIDYFGIKPNYYVSNTGRVINFDTMHELKPYINKQNGYLTLSLMDVNNNVKKVYLHTLVFTHFGKKSHVRKYINSLGKFKYTINHIDGVKTNCVISNLELATYQENANHAVSMNLIKSCDECQNTMVSNDTVHAICRLIEKGLRNSEIRNTLNLPHDKYTKMLITRIRTGKAFKKISNEYNFDKKSTLRHHSDDEIRKICSLMESGLSLKEMRSLLGIKDSDKDRFKKLVYGIRKREIYQDISKDFSL